MAGKLTSFAEVVRRTHQSMTQQMMPDSVDHHATRQRIVATRHPLGQLESATPAGGNRRLRDCFGFAGNLKKPTGHDCTFVADFAANMHMPVAGFLLVLHRHRLWQVRWLGFLERVHALNKAINLTPQLGQALLKVGILFQFRDRHEHHRISDYHVAGVIVRNRDNRLAAGKLKAAQDLEVVVDRRLLALVDKDRSRTIGVPDRHRRLLGAIRPGRVAETNLILASFRQLSSENDLLLPLAFALVVNVVVAKKRLVARRLHPVADFLRLQIVDNDPLPTLNRLDF